MNPIRLALVSLWAVVAAPRVWLTAWLLYTVPAVLVALPFWEASDAALTHHPGATLALDQVLDADLWRNEPATVLRLHGGALFSLLVGAFLAGGVLASLRVGERFRYVQFLGECGHALIGNLRVLLVGLVAALLLGWGLDAARSALVESVFAQAEPGDVLVDLGAWQFRVVHALEIWDLLAGLAFLGLWFASRVAMARLSEGRRSAFAAIAVGVFTLFRHPLRTLLGAAPLLAAWLLLPHLLGELQARFLEGGSGSLASLAAGVLAGQLGVLVGIIVPLAALLVARDLSGSASPRAAEESSGE